MRVRLAATFIFLTLGALAMLIVAIPTCFLLRAASTPRSWRDGWAKPRFASGACAIACTAKPQPADVQTVYVSNHSSTLDVFVLIALGLPRTRFFLSGFLQEDAADRHHRHAHPDLLDGAAGISGQASRDLQARRPHSARDGRLRVSEPRGHARHHRRDRALQQGLVPSRHESPRADRRRSTSRSRTR